MRTDSITLKRAREIAGGLGSPSKMPGASYGLPIAACNVGAKLRAIGPSVNAAGYVNPCGSCYAATGLYKTFAKNVLPAQHKRLGSITHPQWEDAMARLIESATKTVPYFRWHDSGDLQSAEHLSRIARIAERMPHVAFWLPTREARLIRDWLETNVCPPNLTIRISAMATPSARSLAEGRKFSTVSTGASVPDGAQRCPASEPDKPSECGDCRACWDTDVPWIDYHAH